MAEDQFKRPRKLEDVPLEKRPEELLIDQGNTKFKDGMQGTDPQVEQLGRDYKRLLRQLQKHDRLLKDYELGDIEMPVKRVVMQDDEGNPVVLRALNDGTVSIVPFEEDQNYA